MSAINLDKINRSHLEGDTNTFKLQDKMNTVKTVQNKKLQNHWNFGSNPIPTV